MLVHEQLPLINNKVMCMYTIARVDILRVNVLGDGVRRVPPVLKWSELGLQDGPTEVHYLLQMSLSGLITGSYLIIIALTLILILMIRPWWAAAEGILELTHTILNQCRSAEHLSKFPLLFGDFGSFLNLFHSDFDCLFSRFRYKWLMFLI